MKNALRILTLLLLIVGTAFSADKRVAIPIGRLAVNGSRERRR